MGNETQAEDRFGRRVRAERERREWTQADLAKHLESAGLKLHPSAIAKIEQRDVEKPRVIRLDEAEVIGRVFGLSVDEMYETEDHRIRYAGNRMRIWLEKIAEECETWGMDINFDVQEIVAAAEGEEAQNRRDLLLADEFDRFVRAVGGEANHLSSKLRHPGRAEAINWQHPEGGSDDSSS